MQNKDSIVSQLGTHLSDLFHTNVSFAQQPAHLKAELAIKFLNILKYQVQIVDVNFNSNNIVALHSEIINNGFQIDDMYHLLEYLLTQSSNLSETKHILTFGYDIEDNKSMTNLELMYPKSWQSALSRYSIAHLLAFWNDDKSLRLISKHKIDINTLVHDSPTPLQIAIDYNYPHAAETLQELGGTIGTIALKPALNMSKINNMGMHQKIEKFHYAILSAADSVIPLFYIEPKEINEILTVNKACYRYYDLSKGGYIYHEDSSTYIESILKEIATDISRRFRQSPNEDINLIAQLGNESDPQKIMKAFFKNYECLMDKYDREEYQFSPEYRIMATLQYLYGKKEWQVILPTWFNQVLEMTGTEYVESDDENEGYFNIQPVSDNESQYIPR